MAMIVKLLFLLFALPEIVEVQILKECVPYHNCLTCYAYPFNCNNCTNGYYLTRGGAYYTCRKCPSECTECSNRFSCDKCKDGHWGDSCQKNCSRGCLEHICLKQSGICQPQKCKPGFVKDKCDSCSPGKYGLDCNISGPNSGIIWKLSQVPKD
ncbi:R-spondin-3-like [Mercenaria mercenaria]|uniref:R-spondin-3-like n=1 Tax=Mercenaria mercenaria TaxID=6596 RepID=UPI00234ED421|nr:R-spondin-3-like [Mercenaria mercenaria]